MQLASLLHTQHLHHLSPGQTPVSKSHKNSAVLRGSQLTAMWEPTWEWCSLCAMISVSSACWVTASPGCCVTRTPSAPLCLVPHAAAGVICSPAGLVCKSASPVQGTEPVQRASGTGITNISFQNAQRVERSQGLASLDHAWKVQPSKLH